MNSRVLSTLIVIVVASATAIIPLMGESSAGVEPLKSLFLAFVTAIVAIQLIPAIMLLCGFLKATFANNGKKQES